MVTKQISQALEHTLSSLIFSQAIDQVPGTIFVKDKEGAYFAFNNGMGSQFAEEIIGRTDYDVLSKNDADQLRANDREVMENKKQMVFIEKFRTKSGESITACSVKAPVCDKNGNVIGMIGHAVEVSEVRDQLQSI